MENDEAISELRVELATLMAESDKLLADLERVRTRIADILQQIQAKSPVAPIIS